MLLSEIEGASKKYFIDVMHGLGIPATQTESARELRLSLEDLCKSDLEIKPLVSATTSSISFEPVSLDGFVVPTNTQVVLCLYHFRSLSTPSQHSEQCHRYVMSAQGAQPKNKEVTAE